MSGGIPKSRAVDQHSRSFLYSEPAAKRQKQHEGQAPDGEDDNDSTGNAHRSSQTEPELGETIPGINALETEGTGATSAHNHINDIGCLVHSGQDPRSCPDKVKLRFLRSHFRPDGDYLFPRHEEKKKEKSSSRKFQYSWLRQYTWLVYSPKCDGGFCLPCMFFSASSL